jgi:erythromycin esterase-like protein
MTDHSAQIQHQALPLRAEADLDPLLERIGDARYVLIGEASHGTHEYYAWRASLTRRLIQEPGFSFVGVEGDWPDCYAVNNAVTLAPGAPEDPEDVLARLRPLAHLDVVFDETTALDPLHGVHAHGGEMETWPANT